jgi:mycothiol synthase
MRQLLMRRPDLRALPALELPAEVSLRNADGEDVPQLASLLKAAFADDSWTLERVDRALLEAPDVVQTLLLIEDSEIVATASARLAPDRFPGSGYLHWVAADPHRSGRGLGRAISLAVLHVFADLGCKDAVLETDDHRLPAIRTYLNLGFAPEQADSSHQERWQAIREALAARK